MVRVGLLLILIRLAELMCYETVIETVIKWDGYVKTVSFIVAVKTLRVQNYEWDCSRCLGVCLWVVVVVGGGRCCCRFQEKNGNCFTWPMAIQLEILPTNSISDSCRFF